MFTGREFLNTVNMYDFRNRIYSTSIGRFLQIDPIGFNAGDVNIYRYVNNQLLIATDPTGEFPWFVIGFSAGFMYSAVSDQLRGSKVDYGKALAYGLAGAGAGAITQIAAVGLRAAVAIPSAAEVVGATALGGLEGLHGAVAGAIIEDHYSDQPPTFLDDLGDLEWEDEHGYTYDVQIGQLEVIEYYSSEDE